MDNQAIKKEKNLISFNVDENKILKKPKADVNQSHLRTNLSTWWLDFYTTAGRKSENQDSLMVTTCLLDYVAHKQRDKVELKNLKTQQINESQDIANINSDKQNNSNFNINSNIHQSTSSNTANKKLTLKPDQLPVLAVLADGVSACQFPKQASALAIETVTKNIIKGLNHIYRQAVTEKQQIEEHLLKQIFDDESVAGIIKSAIVKANDSMYFSQSYQRVAPLLSTLSGVLCIGDRVHLFHTGDSRIYRLSKDSTVVLSEDHRIHHGQDKGALSAALGADTSVDLQQTVFTLHQNEYLALMTDGVYEHIDPIEMQFEFSAAATQLENTPNWHDLKHWDLSQHLCQQAYAEGSNDNLSIIMLGMGLTIINTNKNVPNKTSFGNSIGNSIDNSIDNSMDNITGNDMTQNSDGTLSEDIDESDNEIIKESTQYKLPTGLEIGDSIDGFEVTKIIARTARSEVYLVQDSLGHEYVLKSPSLRTVDDGEYLRSFLKERKIGLSLSKNKRAGESAYNQTNPNLIQQAQPDLMAKSRTGYSVQVTSTSIGGSALGESGLLRYYPVPASSKYLYHLTEYIEGESLRAFMERNGPSDVWQTHDLLTKIGMAVRVMHRNYLLHQDIKPENILLTKSGAVKLIDFGSVASSILKDNTRPPLGDLHYAAPEYYTDEPKGVHSDLFSIAVIGFELLTGSRPFTSQMLMSASDNLVVPANLLRQKQVPATSQQALLRALHRNTKVRQQAIGEFLQDFNPDFNASLTDPEPLIKRNPLLVWHSICFIQAIVIIFLMVKFLPTL
ncbi:bifunctional protein-serine/threonine kinase/phosphatase [Psychrobacter sp.]|uniref:bifunctional protein-serine/threonine kinase/phosphatase n=1 Tax=Psychrobacter sp. TaxID=56811 RepID=UPI0025DB3AF0|nr:bifunctional protein-serine/threonine kinase/phosphatase [Psychrobacter sp.]